MKPGPMIYRIDISEQINSLRSIDSERPVSDLAHFGVIGFECPFIPNGAFLSFKCESHSPSYNKFTVTLHSNGIRFFVPFYSPLLFCAINPSLSKLNSSLLNDEPLVGVKALIVSPLEWKNFISDQSLLEVHKWLEDL